MQALCCGGYRVKGGGGSSTFSYPSLSPPPAHSHKHNRCCCCCCSMAAASVRIAVVGDVVSRQTVDRFEFLSPPEQNLTKIYNMFYLKHDQWNFEADSKALHFLQPDLVLFTGDFGNENVELVRSIAKLEIAKAVILGNHDCWRTQQFAEKRKDRVQLQLECLGREHVGYHRLDFPMLKLSVVGGRPFSCGGAALFRTKLLSARYGVHDMEGSAKRIYETARRTPEGHSVVFLGHNGPTGLGSGMNDICGRDWIFGGGDHGDPDLAHAISDLRETTQISIPLVVFGHMHKELAHGRGLRKMVVVGEDNTMYLNGAIVPRVRKPFCEQEMTTSTSIVSTDRESNGSLRAFTVVEILDGTLKRIAETWVFVSGDEARTEEEHILFSID